MSKLPIDLADRRVVVSVVVLLVAIITLNWRVFQPLRAKRVQRDVVPEEEVYLPPDLPVTVSSHRPRLKPVGKAIRTKFPLTFELALYAFFPIILGGIWLGKLTAVRHNSVFDHSTRMVVIVGWSFPDFVFGLLVILIFYSWLGWFPPVVLSNWASRVVESADYARYTGLLTLDALLNGRLDIFWDALRHLLGPVTTMTYLWSAFLIGITRSGMLDVLHKDYIRTARAKGLPEKMVIHKHASKNAMIAVLTVAGRLVIYLLTGTVIIETIFNRPGMGKFVAFAAQQLDYSGILGGTLFFSLILVVGNLIVDVLYAVYDPRIQLG